MTWLAQLSQARRASKNDRATFSTYKPLPDTPENADTVDFYCTIVTCSRVKVDTSTNLFKPKQVVVERRVLVSLPGKCDYHAAMAVIESKAVEIFGEVSGRGGDEGRESVGGLAGVSGQAGVRGIAGRRSRRESMVDIGRLWRSEALVRRRQRDAKEGVGLDVEN